MNTKSITININKNALGVTSRGDAFNIGLTKQDRGFLASYDGDQSQRVVGGNIKQFAQFLSDNGFTFKDIDQALINIYQNYLREAGLSNATYNLRVFSLKKYLEFIGIKGLTYKPAKVTPYENMKIISLTDLSNILFQLDLLKNQESRKQLKYHRDHIIFSLLFYTGVRKNELLQLKYNKMFQQGDDLCFRAIGKGRKEITKIIPADIAESLLSLKEKENKSNEDYLFTSQRINSRGKLAHNSLNDILNYYNQKFNKTTRQLSIHGIRNLSGKVLYDATKDMRVVQQHYGHSNSNTTDHYLSGYKNKTSNHYDAMRGALAQ